MNKKNKRLFNLIFLFIAISVLFIIALIYYFANDNASQSTSGTIIIGVTLIVLVIFMIIITKFYKKGRKKPGFTHYLPKDGITSNDKNKDNSIGNKKKDLNNRFFELSTLDDKLKEYQKIEEPKTYTLQEICDKFRDFASNDSGGLYYTIKDIRAFIAGLGVSHIAIFQGMSGTGKTSLAGSFGRFISNPSTIIPIQPMWKERSDLLGYFNEFTKKFNETTLLEVLYEANYSNKIYIVVLDEMNIARIEYYFAEFLSLLELPKQEDRHIEVVNDHWADDPKLLKEGKLLLPPNVWFIGTANNDDSTFAISDKVYDRAMILNLNKKGEEFKANTNGPINISSDSLMSLFNKAIEENSISKTNLKKVEEIDEYLINTYHITFGNRILKQLHTYTSIFISCGGTELEAIDDIIAKKVLRKLESKNPNLVKKNVGNTIEEFANVFGNDNMKECQEYLQELENRY